MRKKPEGKFQRGEERGPVNKSDIFADDRARIITKRKRGPRSVRGTDNDASWYMDDSGLVADAARIATFEPVGNPRYPLLGGSIGETETLGSIMSCYWLPVPGIASSNKDALSISAQVLFQQVRKALNKVQTGYSWADPMIAYICFLSMVVRANEMARDMRVANTFSTVNQNYPANVLHACGYNEQAIVDLRSNMANYRTRYNLLMNDMSSIFMPIETNIMEKYKWLSQYIFTDRESAKAQTYMYISNGYYTYNEIGINSTNGGIAQFKHESDAQRRSKNKLFEYKLSVLQEMVNVLKNSDSYNFMMSDLQRAFPDVSTYSFSLISEDDDIKPVYNEVMLKQFSNIETLPLLDWTTEDPLGTGRLINEVELDANQSVDDNTIVLWPQLAINTVYNVGNLNAIYDERVRSGVEINFTSLNPSTEEVIDAMHGVMHFQLDVAEGKPYAAMHTDGGISCAIYEGFGMQYVTRTEDAGGVKSFVFNNTQFTTYLQGSAAYLVLMWYRLANFDWCPGLYISTGTASSAGTCLLRKAFERDCCVHVPVDTLQMVNKCEQLALWRVPNNLLTATDKY